VLLVASLAALALAGACLPDLTAIAAADEGGVDASVVTRGCGDGIIATLDDGGDAGESCDPGRDAEVLGCSACTVTCSEGILDPLNGHCYFAVGLDSTYQSAVTHCAAKRGHVVTLTSAAEADIVKTVAAGEKGYWVGLLRTDTVGGAYQAIRSEEPGLPFSGATVSAAQGPCPGCFLSGDDAGELPLAAEVDASAESDARCIASIGGRWLRVLCNSTATQRATVCEREPEGARAQDCIGGFCFTLAKTAGQKRYLVAVSATDPDTAAQSCAGLTGGSLVVFTSNEEREQLAHEIRARYPDEVEQQLWIGLAEDGGTWSWDDGVVAALDASSGRPLPWGNAQPAAVAGARAYMRIASTAYDTQLSYADDGKKTPRLYICQRSPD
jgi:hypothetical protein